MKARLIVFFIWSAFFLGSLARHTPWRDEYQSWLVSTRTVNVGEFLNGVSHERHPPLHYLVQRGFASLSEGLDLPAKASIEAVTVPFTVGTVLLLLFLLDLPLLQSVPLIFGTILFREFGLISRAYALGTFFLFAAIFAHRRQATKWQNTFLSLSAGTHMLFTLISGSLWLLFSWDRRKEVIREWSFWLTGLLFLAIVIFQIPPADSSFNRSPDLSFHAFWSFFRHFNQSLWGLEKIWRPFTWNSFAVATDLMLFLFPLSVAWLKSRLPIWRIFFVVTPPLLLLSTSYDLGTRHLGVVFIGFVTTYLLFSHPPLANSKFRRWPEPLTIIAATAFLSSLVWWCRWAPWQSTPNFDFSGARELASSMPDLARNNAIVVTAEAPLFFTWMAEQGTSVYDVQRNSLLRYPLFIKFSTVQTLDDWCSNERTAFVANNRNNSIFLGTSKNEKLPDSCQPASLEFTSQRPTVTDEVFSIYRFSRP